MIDNQKIADLADQAANEIDKRGLAKHLLTDQAGRVCARGAVFAAVLDRPFTEWDGMAIALGVADDICQTEIAVSEAVADHLGLPHRSDGKSRLAQWNNAPERTAEEVSSALRETAASLRLTMVPPGATQALPAPRTTPENVGV
jgi:hypothetical protein